MGRSHREESDCRCCLALCLGLDTHVLHIRRPSVRVTKKSHHETTLAVVPTTVTRAPSCLAQGKTRGLCLISCHGSVLPGNPLIELEWKRSVHNLRDGALRLGRRVVKQLPGEFPSHLCYKIMQQWTSLPAPQNAVTRGRHPKIDGHITR